MISVISLKNSAGGNNYGENEPMRIKRRSLTGEVPTVPDLSPLLQRIYAGRGVKDGSELNTMLKAMLSFETLKDIDKACQRLEQALREQQRLLIIGDFDADGATSTALAVVALKAMGAEQVEYLVPNRFEFGYGLTPAIVEVASRWQPHLIITVDNGIASFDGVDAANARGIDVLITDHHLPAEQTPDAYAIINPNQKACRFPSKSIAGVGVIFYTMTALRRHLSNSGWFKEKQIEPPNMAEFLDLVALGTVADVVGLDQNNRILVRQGLLRIRQGKCRPGIKALVEIAARDLARIRESDLGFAVAPRLNAAGRLDDMSLGIECLISDEEARAQEYACQLNELNLERRHIEAEMKEQAMAALDKLSLQEAELPVALCLFDKNWHQGVIGILAGRLKERYHRPVIVFAEVSEDEFKGSARSVAGLNIRDVLAAIDKDYPGLIGKFGGHAMAAGLSLPPEHLTQFRERFIAEVRRHLNPSECEAEILTDGPLAAEEFSLETARLLEQAGPWGQQFPAPVFDNHFEILEQRLVGQNHLKMTLLPKDSVQPIDAIAFNVDLNVWPNYRAKAIHAAFQLDINVYQERARLQLLIEAMNII